MAYAYHVDGPQCEEIGGKTYMSYLITEVDLALGPNNTFTVDGLPGHFTLALYEATADGTITINPLIGLTETFEEDTLDHVASNLKPTAHVRNACSLRVSAPGHKLCGRTNPTSGAAQATTRITIIAGY